MIHSGNLFITSGSITASIRVNGSLTVYWLVSVGLPEQAIHYLLNQSFGKLKGGSLRKKILCCWDLNQSSIRKEKQLSLDHIKMHITSKRNERETGLTSIRNVKAIGLVHSLSICIRGGLLGFSSWSQTESDKYWECVCVC